MRVAAFTAIALIAFLGVAQAKTATGTMKTTASVTGTCSFSATDAVFGAYNPAAPIAYSNSASQVTSSNINILCNRALAFSIKGILPISKNSGSSIGLYMVGSTSGNTDEIVFNAYTSSALTPATWFGDGNKASNGGATYPIESTGTGANQVIPLYFSAYPASIYPKYLQRPDNYSYSYVLTLTY